MGDYDAALDAACTVIWPEGYDGRQRMRMSNALASAVVDLSSADFAPLSGPFLAGQLDKLGKQLAVVEDLVVDHRAECERLAARPSTADVRVDAAYQRGVEAGRAGQVTSTLEVTSGPTDYEVWRDALLIAAQTVEVKGDTDELVYVARNLVGTLRRAGMLAGAPAGDFAPDDVLFFTEPDEDADDEEDCPNCGTDDDEHEEDCPKQDQGPF